MAKKILFLLWLAVPAFLYGKALSASFDFLSLDSFSKDSVRIQGEAGWEIGEDTILVFPLDYGTSSDGFLSFASTGVDVELFPFPGYGLYLGTSLARFGFFSGSDSPDDQFLFFSEAFTGWRFVYKNGYIDPRLTYLDVFSAQKGSFDTLSEHISQYSKWRFSLFAGIRF